MINPMKNPVKNGKRLALAAATLLCLSAMGCATETPVEAPDLIRPPTAEITTTTIERGNLVEAVRRNGVTRYLSEPLAFDRPVARFGEFHVEPGEFVTEGQLLLTLDTTHIEEDIENQLERIANMERDHAMATDMRQIEINIMRREGAGQANVDRAQMELRQQQARNALQLSHAEIRLEDTRQRKQAASMYAPFDGWVTNLASIAFDDYVAIGRPLVFLADGSQIIIEAVNKPYLEDWPHPGPGEVPPQDPWRPDTVRHAVKIEAHIGGQVFELQYIPVPLDERETRPVRFHILSDNLPPAGEFVELYFYRRFTEDVVLLPDNALFSPTSQPYVYRVVDGEIVFTEVRLAGRTPLAAAVAEGVEPGDVVLVR